MERFIMLVFAISLTVLLLRTTSTVGYIVSYLRTDLPTKQPNNLIPKPPSN